MKIFVSWSGELSQVVAILLRKWLRNVIQVVEPYVSSEDIEKGSRWFADIDNKLDQTGFGIVCLTRENMKKPWILFEAGAISRTIDRSRVTPLLIDLSPADLDGPLSQFQATNFEEADMLSLVKDLGSHLGDPRFDDALIEQSFSKWWPDFAKAVEQAVESVKQHKPRVESRPDREILEEVLQTTRNLVQMISTPLHTSEGSTASADLDPILQGIKDELEKRRKMLLVTVLEGACKASLEGDQFYLEFAPEDRHLRDTLAKADNVRVLREVLRELTGRDIGIRIDLADRDNRGLRKLAAEDPMVQKLLRTFRGEITDVRRIKEED
jgi:hypothetical protein